MLKFKSHTLFSFHKINIQFQVPHLVHRNESERYNSVPFRSISGVIFVLFNCISANSMKHNKTQVKYNINLLYLEIVVIHKSQI